VDRSCSSSTSPTPSWRTRRTRRASPRTRWQRCRCT
jgi:hypothetical protein